MARVKVTCEDPDTGESDAQELDPNSYIVVCGEHMYVAHEQVFPKSGTVQLTLRRTSSSEVDRTVPTQEQREGFGGIA